MSMKRLASRVTRRAALLPLAVVGQSVRAEAIEQLLNESTVECPLPEGTLRFFAPTLLLQERARNVMTKEPEMIPWLRQLQSDDVLWDIGANVGVFSIYAGVTRRCTVVAFEPSAANFYVLTKNIQANRLDDRTTSYCVALSGETKLGVLNLDSPSLGSALTQFGKTGEWSRYSLSHSPLRHGMIGVTVDEFVKTFDPPFPTHLKMDVDGLELPILEGATATLRDPRLKSAIVEISVTNHAERDRALSLMTAAGLHLVSQGQPQGQPGESAANHVFERR